MLRHLFHTLHLHRSLSAPKRTAVAPVDDHSQLTIPGVGIIRQAPSTEGNNVERTALTRRRLSQPGRLQGRTEEAITAAATDSLRASFTLNGTSVSGLVWKILKTIDAERKYS